MLYAIEINSLPHYLEIFLILYNCFFFCHIIGAVDGCSVPYITAISGTTILDAVKEAVGNETEVIYEQCPSTDIIECSEVSFAVVVVGEGPYAECGGDNSELVIPFNGAGIIDLVADKIPTLVILISGRPLLLEQCLLEKIDALVAAWLPVTEAQRITDVIFGDHDFKGQLPMTWFRRVEQLDQPVGVSSCDPLFPLDYGLKYGKENLHD